MKVRCNDIQSKHADMMPPPEADGPVPVDRKAAKESVSVLETPAEALAREAKGGTMPAHYIPVKVLNK